MGVEGYKLTAERLEKARQLLNSMIGSDKIDKEKLLNKSRELEMLLNFQRCFLKKFRGKGILFMVNNLDVELARAPFLKEALEQCSDGILILDSNGIIVYGNRKISKDIGEFCGNFLGKDVSLLHECSYIPKDAFYVIQSGIEIKGSYEGEFKRVDKCGRTLWEYIKITNKVNEDKKAQGFLVVIKDITNIKNTEMSSHYMCREHYDCIFRDSHLSTLLIEPETGKIVEANNAACLFYGYSNSEIIKKYIWEINCLGKEEVLIKMKTVSENSKPGLIASKQFSFQHRISDGTIKDVDVRSGMINMHGKNLIYSVVIDISDRKKTERLLAQSEEKYRVLVELSPEAIFVNKNGIIRYANQRALKYIGVQKESDLIGKSIIDFINEDYHDIVRQRGYRVQNNKEILRETDVQMLLPDGKYMDCEVSLAPIDYEGQSAIIVILRDITEKRKEMERAKNVQAVRQRIRFPLLDKAKFENVYIPAAGLSGDFFHFHRLGNHKVIGILGDVSGKGLSAALSISAIKVLFYDGIGQTSDPLELLKYMNIEVARHLNEDYVAVCCFLLDFEKRQAAVVSAGINQFITMQRDGLWKKHIVEGPFLGMFEKSLFEKKIHNFDSGDSFYFYSDGADFVFDDDNLCERFLGKSLLETKESLHEILKNTNIMNDDFTWLGIEIN